MQRMNLLRRQSANLLTGVRVVLTPAFIVATARADANTMWGVGAAIAFVIIAASDVWDGRLARRYGSASPNGRVFDHLADIVFIVGALSMYGLQALVPWWVPAAIAASFAVYVFDSWSVSGAGTATLVGSRIGHLAGICNYVLVGVLAFNNSAGIHLLPTAFLSKLFWLVPLYSAAAVISRLASRHAGVSAIEPA